MIPLQTRTFAVLAAVATIAALGGCGEPPATNELTVSFQGPSAGSLAKRSADMRRAVQLFIDGPGKDVAGNRLKLVIGPAPGSIATIDALASRVQYGPDELEISLAPPLRREVAGRGRASAANLLALTPPKSLAERAAAQYRASGVAGSARATVDSPLTPGTPRGRYVTAALAQHSYPPAGSVFFKKFQEQYGHAPDRWAIYAYEAAGLIADAIRRLDKQGIPVSQRTVRNEALRVRNRYGAIGHYDILPSGQTTDYVFQARGPGTDPEDPATLIETLR